MKRIIEAIDEIYEQVTYNDWDAVGVVGGGEGSGKSNLDLHLYDHWNKRLHEDGHRPKPKPEKLIKYISLSMEQFLDGLKDLKRFGMLVYDEAGELSSMRMMNKFNYKVTKTYEVVRGANLMTILTLPDVFFLNPFFSTRRARFYMHVYKRGRVAFWDQARLQKMIALNKGQKVKKPWRVKPMFYDTFPKYKGPMLKHYMAKKEEKMTYIRHDLYEELVTEESEKFAILQAIKRSHELLGEDLTLKRIAHIFGIAERTIYKKIKDLEAIQKKHKRLV